MARCWKTSNLRYWVYPGAQSTLGKRWWDSLVSVGFQIKMGRPKFYDGEIITPSLGLRNYSDRGLANLPCLEPACNYRYLCYKQKRKCTINQFKIDSLCYK